MNLYESVKNNLKESKNSGKLKANEGEAPQTYERGNAPFESKRVPEDRIREEGYLYFSTHGTGPGTKPRDVRVREMDWDLPGGWVAIKTDRPLTSEELDWYDIQPETKNNYYRQRFHLEETDEQEYNASSSKLPSIETFDIENTGGHIMVGYGKLSDGTYYSISTDVICIWDTDWYKLHFEEPEEDEENYDDPNATIDDEVNHIIKYYDYNTPEYKMYAEQCLAMDKDKASYCVYLED